MISYPEYLLNDTPISTPVQAQFTFNSSTLPHREHTHVRPASRFLCTGPTIDNILIMTTYQLLQRLPSPHLPWNSDTFSFGSSQCSQDRSSGEGVPVDGVRHLGYFGSFDFAPSRQKPVKIKSKSVSKTLSKLFNGIK